MESLQNHFLVASPYLEDPRFHGSVVYLCEHSAEGALGLMINRPLDIQLGEILEQMDLEGGELVTPVMSGGPVQPERGFVLHKPGTGYHQTAEVSGEVFLTTSRDILVSIGEGQGPEQYVMTLGYSGWERGQLEEELSGDSWLTCPADPAILFDTPWSSRYEAALRLIGVNLNQLSGGSGHA